jgi:lipoprotein-anchoring transpeptidase ErfK/SrfK
MSEQELGGLRVEQPEAGEVAGRRLTLAPIKHAGSRALASNRFRIVAGIVLVALLLVALGVGLWSYTTTNQTAAKYDREKSTLVANIQVAREQGYTNQDLKPVTSRLDALSSSPVPWFLPSRPSYYHNALTQTLDMQQQLKTMERQQLDLARNGSTQQLASASSVTGQAQQAQAADFDVQSLQQRMDAANKALGAAHSIREYRAVLSQAQAIAADATALLNQTQQENQQILDAAQQLIAQSGGNLQSIQHTGGQATSAGRNDAAIAAYVNKSSPFPGYDGIQRAYSRLEKFAPLVGSGDGNQAAQGTAGVQRYSQQVHNAVFAGLPNKIVLVSFQDQHLWALQGGQVQMETPVTTGIRGITDYGTDFGPMKVVHKDHPWKMHSPWPHGSPLWYPDTVVQWATFFTNTGESIHDASWEADSQLGPGSQYDAGTRSHGCIHVPYGDAQWMYNFADLGMMVLVYPGDGAPVANQLSLMTTDEQGVPHSQ